MQHGTGSLSAKERLILALDVPEPEPALQWVQLLKDEVGIFKVGLQLYTAAGPTVVRRIRELGGEVFLDLKLHDIPNTVAGATAEACRLGVRMLTLHTLGGAAMLRAARQSADETAAGVGVVPPALLGVTVLTSLSAADVARLGFRESVEDLVLRLALQGQGAGLDGLVCSPWEVTRLRSSGVDRGFLVTPGIRPQGTPVQDQARAATASEALAMGADYLVVGRPVLKSPNPIEAARLLVSEMEAAKI